MGRRKSRSRKSSSEGFMVEVDVAPLNQLLHAIEALPGQKQLTLCLTDGRISPMGIDKAGRYGARGPIDKALFTAKLVTALLEGGGITIRQVTPLSMEVECPEHGRIQKPICNLYGVAFGNNQFEVIPADEVEWAHTHDARTGEQLGREPNVRFAELPLPDQDPSASEGRR